MFFYDRIVGPWSLYLSWSNYNPVTILPYDFPVFLLISWFILFQRRNDPLWSHGQQGIKRIQSWNMEVVSSCCKARAVGQLFLLMEGASKHPNIFTVSPCIMRILIVFSQRLNTVSCFQSTYTNSWFNFFISFRFVPIFADYHVGSDLGWSPVFWFVTPPMNLTEWAPSIAIYGDMGNVNAQSLPRLQSETQAGLYDSIIHVGDFAYNMDDVRELSLIFVLLCNFLMTKILISSLMGKLVMNSCVK